MISTAAFETFTALLVSCFIIDAYMFCMEYFNNGTYPLKVARLSRVKKILYVMIIILPWLLVLRKLLLPLIPSIAGFAHRVFKNRLLFPMASTASVLLMYLITKITNWLH